MSKVAKKQTKPTLNHVEQAVKSPILTFHTDCNKSIEVLETSLLQYIDDTEMNVIELGDGYSWTPETISSELTIDAKEYLEDNFETVTQMYFDQVLIFTMKEASSFIQGYTKSLLAKGETINKSIVNKIIGHVHNQFGIRMEVA